MPHTVWEFWGGQVAGVGGGGGSVIRFADRFASAFHLPGAGKALQVHLARPAATRKRHHH